MTQILLLFEGQNLLLHKCAVENSDTQKNLFGAFQTQLLNSRVQFIRIHKSRIQTEGKLGETVTQEI